MDPLTRILPESLTRRSEVYDRYAAVLRAAVDTATEEERRLIDDRLHWTQHRRALATAVEAARTGDRGAARRSGRAAFGGSARISMEAAVLMVAPLTAAKVSDRVRRRSLR